VQILEFTPAKFDELFVLIEQMIAEAEFKDAILNKDKIKDLWAMSENAIYLAQENDKLIGFIAGMIQPYFFSERKRVTDMGFFVQPEYRGSSAAIKLIKALENWARQNNVVDICLGQTTAFKLEETQKFYNRLGYKTVGFNTVKHLDLA
jgi:GNAT superfamily N-acetyltransferase